MQRTGQSAVEFSGESRIHIGLAVRDIGSAREFYRNLLGVEPCKERPGYVKFEPRHPSVNLTLNQTRVSIPRPAPPAHYGIQVKTRGSVESAIERFRQAGLPVEVEEQVTCCYATQDKVWTQDPDGNRWEVFVVLESDAERRVSSDTPCCSGQEAADGSCCQETTAQEACCTNQ